MAKKANEEILDGQHLWLANPGKQIDYYKIITNKYKANGTYFQSRNDHPANSG